MRPLKAVTEACTRLSLLRVGAARGIECRATRPVRQARQTSAEAADAAAGVALTAANAGMGPAQRAQEDACVQRLHYKMMDNVSGRCSYKTVFF